MNEPLPEPSSPRLCLSDMIDGEADLHAQQRACDYFADDVQGRQSWHEFHLIGDILRSEDLASNPDHDAAFLKGFRARLAREPVILAPSRAHRARRWPWAAPMALAAGFVAVAGVLVVLRMGVPAVEPSAPTLAVAPPSDAQARVLRVTDGQMLRDARVDEYLRAHRATLAGSPAALPGGAMRNVELILPPR